MTRYITLIRYTEQGVRHIKKSPARALAFRKMARQAGVGVETQLWTAGAWDGVLVLSGDEKDVLRCLAQLAAAGHVRTETMRAFDAKEFEELVR
jgi:uncharacterized protein with GYD domain